MQTGACGCGKGMAVTMIEKLIELIDKYNSNVSDKARIVIEKNFPLSQHCTFKIGGPADIAAYPRDIDALSYLAVTAASLGVPYITLGNGSNVLVSDDGYRGLVIITTKLNSIRSDDNKITAECGASLISVTREALGAALTGIEFAYGIPGSVGGAVFMNAGAYEGQMSDVIGNVKYLDTKKNKIIEISNAECNFGYRTSIFSDDSTKIVLSAVFALEPGGYDDIKSKMDDYMQRRIDKQPLEYPSAGSIFKRCPGHFTGRLIEEAGLKGMSVGGAMISPKHAGFIINTGTATAADVLALISLVKQRIYNDKGIVIECEVRQI